MSERGGWRDGEGLEEEGRNLRGGEREGLEKEGGVEGAVEEKGWKGILVTEVL